jgi:hypothetical protein
MLLCSDANIKVDFVIPTRDKPNDTLIHVLEHMPCTGQIIITRERPLSIARKRAVLRAKTEWVAMVEPQSGLHIAPAALKTLSHD